jgi:hypothetical protein
VPFLFFLPSSWHEKRVPVLKLPFIGGKGVLNIHLDDLAEKAKSKQETILDKATVLEKGRVTIFLGSADSILDRPVSRQPA